MPKVIDKFDNITVSFGKNCFLVACCCGHGRYPTTIVVKYSSGRIREVLSETDIPRTRNFYKLDSEGFYYIPEVVK